MRARKRTLGARAARRRARVRGLTAMAGERRWYPHGGVEGRGVARRAQPPVSDVLGRPMAPRRTPESAHAAARGDERGAARARSRWCPACPDQPALSASSAETPHGERRWHDGQRRRADIAIVNGGHGVRGRVTWLLPRAAAAAPGAVRRGHGEREPRASALAASTGPSHTRSSQRQRRNLRAHSILVAPLDASSTRVSVRHVERRIASAAPRPGRRRAPRAALKRLRRLCHHESPSASPRAQ